MSLKDSIKSFIDSYDVSQKSTFRCRVKHQCILDDSGDPAKIVANYGLVQGERAFVKRQGMYHNFTIEALQRIHPIVTDRHVLESLKIVSKIITNHKGDLQKKMLGVARTLGISDFVLESGVSAQILVYFALDEWMEFNKFDKLFNDTYDSNQIPANIQIKVRDHIQRQRHQPLGGRFRIINCGYNSKKKEPVVPIEWTGRIFDDGHALHSAMDKLDSRKGEPPTMYCTIYSMHILEEKTWIDITEFSSLFKSSKNIMMYVIRIDKNNVIKSDRYTNLNKNVGIFKGSKFKSLKGFIQIGETHNHHVWVGVHSRLLNSTPVRKSFSKVRDRTSHDKFLSDHLGSGSVGYMSSLLQKCIRRGGKNQALLITTLDRLNRSVPYNLPDHNFALVSGTRQMLWRSFISIIEDAKGYVVSHDTSKDSIDMRSMFLLAAASNADPELQISNAGMVSITQTMKNIQSNSDLWDWRAYGECKNNKVLSDYVMRVNDEDETHRLQLTDAISLSLDLMPMMSNDKKMLRKTMTYILDKNNPIHELGDDVIQKLKSPSHIIDSQYGTAMAAMDMHCNPTMLINLQAMLRLNLSEYPQFTPELQRLAHFIWNNVSRYNYRYSLHSDAPEDHNSIINLYSESEIKTHLRKTGLKPKSREFKKALKLQSAYIDGLSRDCLQKLTRLQEVIILKRWPNFVKWVRHTPTLDTVTDSENSNSDRNIGRVAWLILFGQSRSFRYKNRVYQIILASDDPSKPCKIKRHNQKTAEYVTGDLRDEIEEEFLSNFPTERVRVYPLLAGYEWTFNDSIVQISYSAKSGKFLLNSQPVTTLDLSSMIHHTSRVRCALESPEDYDRAVSQTFYLDTDTDSERELIFRLGDIAYFRREFEDYRVFDWANTLIKTGVSNSLRRIMRIVLARLFTSDIDGVDSTYTLKTGPCDRRGKKTQNSISYSYEGVIYRIFCFLEATYPRILRRRDKNPKNIFDGNGLWRYGGTVNGRWVIDRDSPEYLHLIKSIDTILQDQTERAEYTLKSVNTTSNLWEHQSKTVTRIYDGMTRLKIRGFGDASHVGAGKTLCALTLMARLYNLNYSRYEKKETMIHSGFLVMVPNNSLIDTWKDEAIKHFTSKTERFDLIFQQANGDLLRWDYEMEEVMDQVVLSHNILPHSLIISTMGRVRDHPIRHPWILTVIDECLSVQNKEALQTEEAWRQSCHSEHGIMMLSATFFRSRFDKMLYMLKMLRSGLPEQRMYLDSILSEHVISNITKTDRIWEIRNLKHSLSKAERIEYQRIYDRYSVKNAETLYLKLNDFIHNRVDYIQIFNDALDEAEKQGKTCVIFTKSKREADEIANLESNAKRVGRYPQKKTHTVLSYSEGTYGLNDLVKYDTIVMRPPEPDKLPQIKGRLDRPGQKKNKLSIMYVLLKDTIEEAGLIRLELCNRFYSNYLMPLAEFYEMAVRTPKSTNKSKSTKSKSKTKRKLVVESKTKRVTKAPKKRPKAD